MQSTDVPIQEKRCGTWVCDERNNPCPDKTKPAVRNGVISIVIGSDQLEAPMIGAFGHNLRIRQGQQYSVSLANTISLFESLTGHCVDVIKAAGKEIHSRKQFGGFDEVIVGNAEVIGLMFADHQAREKRRRRSPGDADNHQEDTVDSFRRRMKSTAAWSKADMQVYAEVIPGKECDVSLTVGEDRIGSRSVSAVKFYGVLSRPVEEDEEDETEGLYSSVNWEIALLKYITKNVTEKRSREAKVKSNGSGRGAKNFTEQDVREQMMLRPMLYLESGLQYLREFAIRHHGMNDNGILGVWRSQDTVNVHTTGGGTGAGVIDWRKGPWSADVCAAAPGCQVADVYGLVLLLRRGMRQGALPAKYPSQLGDDSVYLGHRFTNPAGELMGPAAIRDEVQQPNFNLFRDGVDFSKLLLRHPELRRCIFKLDPVNIDGDDWITSREPFSRFWEHTMVREQTTQLTGGVSIMPSVLGLSIPGIPQNRTMSKPLTVDMLTTAPVPAYDDGNVVMVCGNPVEVMKPEFSRRINDHRANQEAMLATGMKDPTDETDERPEEGQSLSDIQTAAAIALIEGCKNMACACEGARAVFTFMTGPDGIFGDASGYREVKRVVVDAPFAPDMSSGCQAVAYFMAMCELSGMSSLHGLTHMCFLSSLDGMIISDDIYLNMFLEGGAATGKSFVIKLMKDILITGTLQEEQHETTQSCYQEGGSEFCTIKSRNEFEHGLIVSSGGRQLGDGETTEAGERAKEVMADHVLVSKTANVDGGHRSVIRVVRSDYTVRWWASNRSATDLPPAFLDRLQVEKATSTNRDGLGVSDFTSWGRKPGSDSDPASDTMKMYTRQAQAFVALFGNLAYNGVICAMDTTAFALASKRMNDQLMLTGGVMRTRTIAKAQKVARTLMYEQMYYRYFCREHAMCGQGMRFTERDMFAGIQGYVMQASMVVSDVQAMQAMQHAYDARQGDAVTAVCQAIMHLVMHDRTHPNTYDKLFVPHRETASQTAALRQRGNYVAEPLDFNYMWIQVGKDIGPFCALLVHIMKNTQGSALSSDQIRTTLMSMTDPERDWAVCRHNPLDLMIPPDYGPRSTTDPTPDMCMWTMYSDRERRGIATGVTTGVPMELVLASESRWLAGGEIASVYFPFVAEEGEMVQSKCCDMSHVQNTGYLVMSTAAVLGQAHRSLGDTETAFAGMASSNTLHDFPCVRSVAPSPASYGAQTPNLPPTGRHRQAPAEVTRVNNPYFCSDEGWKRVRGGVAPRASARSMRHIEIPPMVSLDSHLVAARVGELATQDHTKRPSACVIFWADPSAAEGIVAPGILKEMCTAYPSFLELPETQRRDLIRAFIHAELPYLVYPMWPTPLGGWEELPPTPDTNDLHFKTRATEDLTDHVFDLSNAKGVGRMREVIMEMKGGQDELVPEYNIQSDGLDPAYYKELKAQVKKGAAGINSRNKKRREQVIEECGKHTAARPNPSGKYITEYNSVNRPREQTLLGYIEIVNKAVDKLRDLYNTRMTARHAPRPDNTGYAYRQNKRPALSNNMDSLALDISSMEPGDDTMAVEAALHEQMSAPYDLFTDRPLTPLHDTTNDS